MRISTRLPAAVLLLSLCSLALVTAKNIHRPAGFETSDLEVLGTPDLSSSFLGGNTTSLDKAAEGVVEVVHKKKKKKKTTCHDVHKVNDKCAFIHKYCDEEAAGIFNYLDLYYCRLNNARGVAFLVIGLWLCVLFSTIGIAASDFFSPNLSTIASVLGMSESLAGVTFLALGNGSPDVFSTLAAMKINSGSLAVGELIGAASFITAVVAGSMAIVRPFKVGRRSFLRDVIFFTFAVIFSMVFLIDGHIRMWECIVMIAFYLFYVMFVFGWHWLNIRKKERRRKERRARSHAITEEEQDLLLAEDDDEDAGVGPADEYEAALDRGHDFDALERAAHEDQDEEDEEDEEEAEQREFAHLSEHIRVRPRLDRRMTPKTPHSIRPSLVGALEFRAVLTSLKNSGRGIHLRRYSDDPSSMVVHTAIEASAGGDYFEGSAEGDGSLQPSPHIIGHTPSSLLRPNHHLGPGGRLRAVSDATHTALDPRLLYPTNSPEQSGRRSAELSDISSNEHSDDDNSPAHHPITQPLQPRPKPPPLSTANLHNFNHLNPPNNARNSAPVSPLTKIIPRLQLNDSDAESLDSDVLVTVSPSPRLSPRGSPRGSPCGSPRGTPRGSPALSPHRSGISSPLSPLSPHTRSRSSTLLSGESLSPLSARPPSIRLPRASIESSLTIPSSSDAPENWKPVKYWPYAFLPPPQELYSVLFPTLNNWKDKSFIEKTLAVLSAPSVFFLTITLPVVDSPTNSSDPADGSTRTNNLPPESPASFITLDTAHSLPPTSPAIPKPTSSIPPDSTWTRWLTATHCILSPLFITLIVLINQELTPLTLRPFLLSLLAGLTLLFLLFLLTTPNRHPPWTLILCFSGFVVSIAWISTIAGEVVGVLKAIGVVLNISDAILGLTIFAVGNSLGDLVADITIARLGFPVMALAACFGGPMLNILLGVGLSGVYMLWGGGKQGEAGYKIEVSNTLIVSAATLLVTLVVLGVWVPLNNWWMDRRIGWTLVGIWGVGMCGGVVLEILGLGE